jgi:hypothetical protein
MTQLLELTTDLVLDATIHKDDPKLEEVRTSYAQVQVAIAEFEEKVWERWLQRVVGTSGPHSFEGQSEDVQLLVFATGGRIMMTLHRAGDQLQHVTLLGAQKGTQSIGLQGIKMTADQAISILRDACRLSEHLWNAFRTSTGVSFAGL